MLPSSLPYPWRRIAASLYRCFVRGVLYPSFWVSGAIASLVFWVQDTLGLNIDGRPALLIFAIALIPYNLDRIADSYFQTIPDPQAQAYFRQGWGWVVLLLAVITTAILLYQAPAVVRWVSLGGLVPLIYGLPLIPWQGGDRRRWLRLKDIPATKAWIVAGVITYALIALPLAYAGASFTRSAAITGLFLLIFIGTNSHLFDVRDLASDRQAGVWTLPRLIGVDGNRRLWTALNLLALALVAWGWSQGLAVPPAEIALPCVGTNLLALALMQPETPRDLYDLCVDGYLFLPSLIVAVQHSLSS